MEYADRVINSNVKDADPDRIDAQKLAKEKFDMQKTVYLKNLDYSLTEEELYNMCEDLVGQNCVYRLKIPLDRKTQEPRGFAHIEFKTQENVELAITALTGVEVFDRTLEASRMMPPPKISPSQAKRDEEEAVLKRQEEEEAAFREKQRLEESKEKEDFSAVFQDVMRDLDVSGLDSDKSQTDKDSAADDEDIIGNRKKKEEEMV